MDSAKPLPPAAGPKAFAVKHRQTGAYFAGFDSHGAIQWATLEQAQRLTSLMARAQAHLLRRDGVAAQLKPVKCGGLA